MAVRGREGIYGGQVPGLHVPAASPAAAFDEKSDKAQCSTGAELSRARELWRRLTAPSDSIEKQSDQISARLLSSTLILAVPLALFILLTQWKRDPAGIQGVDLLVLAYLSWAWLFAYFLSRTAYYRWSVVFLAWMSTLTLMSFHLLGQDILPLYFIILPVLLSSIALDVPSTAGLALVIVGGTLVVPALWGQGRALDLLGGEAGFVCVGALLTLVLSIHERRLREARTRELRGRVEAAEMEAAEREEARQMLLRDAFHDHLTGLASRPLFEDRLLQAMLRSKRLGAGMVGVLYMDLDHFKITNERYGNRVGDELLVRLAGLLKEIVRPVDTVGRFGGDEFVVLLENIAGLPEAVHVAERIRSSLESPIMIDGQKVYATGSIGVLLVGRHYQEVEAIFRDADAAMYRAKAKGGGRYEIFDRSLRDQVDGRDSLESEICRGLEQGQFLLYFQPISSIKTDAIISFEALLRWNHPDLGMIFPAEFIPLAEETGLIEPLGIWVVKEACLHLVRWRTRYPTASLIGMNINLSARQLLQQNLIDQVRGVILDAGIETKSINFEIRENVITQNLDAAVNSITALKGLGVGIQVDDFGRGYSSFSHINYLPVDTLKIDRSFVQAPAHTDRNRDSTRSIIEMGHRFGLTIVAEGIETEQQMRMLQVMGADFGQGYYISRPIKAIHVEERLRDEADRQAG
jgi:diguanylate cyclase (GGDEF)-like protein